MGDIKAAITGINGYVPDYVLTNKELENMVETNDEWITTRTGIKERRILKGEGKDTSDLRVEVHRDGKIFEQEYKIGVPQYDVREIGTTEKTGTFITFQPDISIFEDTVYHYDILVARLRELAFLNKGINLSITDKRRTDDEGEFVKEAFY